MSRPGLSRPLGLALCAAALAAHAALAWGAVRTKSPTFDEPLHALAASIALEQRDFRIDYDNPPLWKLWAALPNAASPARFDPGDPHWQRIPADLLQQWPFTMRTLYREPANDPDRLIGRSRAMMLVLALALGALIARWAWQLGGPVAALAATGLFALDPNFLAHGPLVKNDVAIALLLTALGYTAWRQWTHPTPGGALGVGLWCGAACAVKLSGLVLPLAAAALLAVRAAGPASFGAALRAGAALAAVALVTVGCIWGAYGFRFAASPDPGVAIDTARLLAAIGGERPSPPIAAVVWALEQRLLPEAWLNGLLFGAAGALRRPLFALGQHGDAGWWWYAPLVALVKTPLATLLAIAAAAGVAWPRLRERRGGGALACLAVPPLVYAVIAVATPAAAGVRHLLPIAPFAFVACGVAAARVWPHRPARWGVAAIALGLALETASAFPDYVAYFNAAAGGSRGGLRLLGDSNLDWGQDLPALAEWQRRHPEPTLHLAYFGSADPAHYGIRYRNLPGGYPLGPPPRRPSPTGVLAVSATRLQGIGSAGRGYAFLLEREPLDVLGGSIYLYPVAPAPEGR